ncbi:MAG: malto-oligosyltrehalose trehalohydrolase [Pirellulaceae bacterium]|nr:malto-oligosyltrehalose trehalohydrolase [Planctomycetales bacterium]
MQTRTTNAMPTDSAPARVLVTDLDGTLIPLPNDATNQADLQRLHQLLLTYRIPLVFATGRHLQSVTRAISDTPLPHPHWFVCDVGTSIYHTDGTGQIVKLEEYAQHLRDICAHPVSDLVRSFRHISGIQLQEEQKQGEFKLSYYVAPSRLMDVVEQMVQVLQKLQAPFEVTHSRDPHNDRGLVDLLPEQVSKAYALRWWAAQRDLSCANILYAGDSGNDLAAFRAGYRSIVVANTHHEVKLAAYEAHRANDFDRRLYFAPYRATSGVLAGCHWYGLFPDHTPDNCATADDATPTHPTTIDEHWGAWPVAEQRTAFRIWAPKRKSLAVEFHDTQGHHCVSLNRDPRGFFSGTVDRLGTGDLYSLRLDDQLSRPDPASRYQPEGVHGRSQVIDPNGFPWQDVQWTGIDREGLIIYELHVGTFTAAGTFDAAIGRLPELVDLGITAVELLPLAQAAGARNWGYDGVDLFAVPHPFGTPDDLRFFVDACHRLGLAVLLDVVYNHLGPEGNYLADFGPYFSRKHHTPWGPALNFDGPHSSTLRSFIIANAIHWLREYHIDGLRCDAVHFMHDDSRVHILSELSQSIRQLEQQTGRRYLLIAETNVYDARTLDQRENIGHGFDALWCDDLMHSILSIGGESNSLTHREYRGALDVAEALRFGYIYAGQPYRRANSSARKECPDLGGFVVGLQNHDTVGNHPLGLRIHQAISVEFQRAAAALTLLLPTIPLIFMGEEFASPAPFLFFVDFADQRLRRAVEQGRAREYPHQQWGKAVSATDPKAFAISQRGEIQDGDPSMWRWYQQLIALRKRWRSSGLLTQSRLHVECRVDQSLFILRYASAAEYDAFVASRLMTLDTAKDACSVPLPIDVTQVLLDSNSDPFSGAGGPTTTELWPQQAVVGYCRSTAR